VPLIGRWPGLKADRLAPVRRLLTKGLRRSPPGPADRLSLLFFLPPGLPWAVKHSGLQPPPGPASQIELRARRRRGCLPLSERSRVAVRKLRAPERRQAEASPQPELRRVTAGGVVFREKCRLVRNRRQRSGAEHPPRRLCRDARTCRCVAGDAGVEDAVRASISDRGDAIRVIDDGARPASVPTRRMEKVETECRWACPTSNLKKPLSVLCRLRHLPLEALSEAALDS